MEEELKRCPFCGEPAEINMSIMGWIVGCDGKEGPICPGYIWKAAPRYLTKEQAIRYWNGREESMVPGSSASQGDY